jgi:hypothetical protein
LASGATRSGAGVAFRFRKSNIRRSLFAVTSCALGHGGNLADKDEQAGTAPCGAKGKAQHKQTTKATPTNRRATRQI